MSDVGSSLPAKIPLKLPALAENAFAYTKSKAEGELLDFHQLNKALEEHYDSSSVFFPSWSNEDRQSWELRYALYTGDIPKIKQHMDLLEKNINELTAPGFTYKHGHGFIINMLCRALTDGHTEVALLLHEKGLLTPEKIGVVPSYEDRKVLKKQTHWEIDVTGANRAFYSRRNGMDRLFVAKMWWHAKGDEYSTLIGTAMSESSIVGLLCEAGFETVYASSAPPPRYETERALKRARFWRKIHGVAPPEGLESCDLSHVNMEQVNAIYTLLCRSEEATYGEDGKNEAASSYTALGLHLLFGGPKDVLRAWQRLGVRQHQSLLKLCEGLMFEVWARAAFPETVFFQNPDPMLWRELGAALLKKGPQVLKDAAFMKKILNAPVRPGTGPDFWKAYGMAP